MLARKNLGWGQGRTMPQLPLRRLKQKPLVQQTIKEQGVAKFLGGGGACRRGVLRARRGKVGQNLGIEAQGGGRDGRWEEFQGGRLCDVFRAKKKKKKKGEKRTAPGDE